MEDVKGSYEEDTAVDYDERNMGYVDGDLVEGEEAKMADEKRMKRSKL